MQEPPKAALLEYEASGRQGPKPARQAACIIQLPAEPGSAVAETIVDLSSPSPTIVTWDRVSCNTLHHLCLLPLHACKPSLMHGRTLQELLHMLMHECDNIEARLIQALIFSCQPADMHLRVYAALHKLHCKVLHA